MVIFSQPLDGKQPSKDRCALDSEMTALRKHGNELPVPYGRHPNLPTHTVPGQARLQA